MTQSQRKLLQSQREEEVRQRVGRSEGGESVPPRSVHLRVLERRESLSEDMMEDLWDNVPV